MQKLAGKLVWSSVCNLIQGWVWVIWKGVFVLVVLIVFVSFLQNYYEIMRIDNGMVLFVADVCMWPMLLTI